MSKSRQVFVYDEIESQPDVIRKILKDRIREKKAGVVFREPSFAFKNLNKISRIYTLGCGTFYNAALTGRYILEHISRIPTETNIPSEFAQCPPAMSNGVSGHPLVILISRSGTIPELVDAAAAAHAGKARVIAMVNRTDSPLARKSDGVIDLAAGPETAFAATKTFSAALIAFYLFVIYLRRNVRKGSGEEEKKLLGELLTLPRKMEKILEGRKKISSIARKYAHRESYLFLGRGINYPSALEGALKAKETAHIHAEGYAAGEMKHGPIALIEKGFPTICIATRGPLYDKMISNIEQIRARKGAVIAIATAGDQSIRKVANDVIEIPRISDIFSPVLTSMPLQLLAYYLTQMKGSNPR